MNQAAFIASIGPYAGGLKYVSTEENDIRSTIH
jgi:hypothetical protein